MATVKYKDYIFYYVLVSIPLESFSVDIPSYVPFSILFNAVK